MWKVVIPHYYIDDNLCKIGNIDSNLVWLVINHFCKPVNYDKDQVEDIFFFLSVKISNLLIKFIDKFF